MCKRKRLIITALLFINGLLIAQNADPEFIRDSIAIKRVKLARPQFKFDDRVTFNGGQALSINGFDAGLLFKDKLRVTLGYYALSSQLNAYNIVRNDNDYTRLIRLKYGSLNTELIYKEGRFYSLGMPLEIAAGTNTFIDKNLTTGELGATTTGALMFVNFGMSGTLKPMRFIGLKVITGYRKVVFNQVKDFNFDGFFTSIGLNLDVHELITDVKMYRLEKRCGHGRNFSNAIDIITN